jgi:hypothetical protein
MKNQILVFILVLELVSASTANAHLLGKGGCHETRE